MTAESTRATVQRYVAALNSGDIDAITACVTDDFFNEHTSALAQSSRGKDAYRERLPQFLAAFAALRYEQEDTIVERDRAAVLYEMTCRWHDRRPVRLRGVFCFEVRDGRIAHRVDYWDGIAFQRQVEEPA